MFIKLIGFKFELFIIHMVYGNNQNLGDEMSFKTHFCLEKEGDTRGMGQIHIVFGIIDLTKCQFGFANLFPCTDTMRMGSS